MSRHLGPTVVLAERLLFCVTGTHVPHDQSEEKCLRWLSKHEPNYCDFDFAREYFAPVLSLLRSRAEARSSPNKASVNPKTSAKKVRGVGGPYLNKEAKSKFEALLAILEAPKEQVSARAPSPSTAEDRSPPTTHALASGTRPALTSRLCGSPHRSWSQVLVEFEAEARIQSLMAANAMLQVRDAGRLQDLEQAQEQIRQLTQEVADLKAKRPRSTVAEPMGRKRAKLDAPELPAEHELPRFASLLEESRQVCSPTPSDETDDLADESELLGAREFVQQVAQLLEHDQDGGGVLANAAVLAADVD